MYTNEMNMTNLGVEHRPREAEDRAGHEHELVEHVLRERRQRECLTHDGAGALTGERDLRAVDAERGCVVVEPAHSLQ